MSQIISDISWFARSVIQEGLRDAASVGNYLSRLSQIFWPVVDGKSVDCWAQIKDQVSEAINVQISHENWLLASSDLGDPIEGVGLIGVIQQYQKLLAAKPQDKVRIDSAWQTLDLLFIDRAAGFELDENQIVLLPLWVQMATMHLSLRRDGVQMGQCDPNEMQERMQTYMNYASRWTAQAIQNAAAAHPGKWSPMNQVARIMQTTVSNFVSLWEYLDPSVYPQSVPAEMFPVSEEIFYSILENIPQMQSNETVYVIPPSKKANIDYLKVYEHNDASFQHQRIGGVVIYYRDSNPPSEYTGYYSKEKPPQTQVYDVNSGQWTADPILYNLSDRITRIDGCYSADYNIQKVTFTTKNGNAQTLPYDANNMVGTWWPVSLVAPKDYWFSSMWMPDAWTDCVFGFREGSYRPINALVCGVDEGNWQADVPVKGSTNWVQGYSVQYAFSYVFAGNPNTDGNPGYWCDPIPEDGYALPTLTVPALKQTNVVARKIWRKFKGKVPELVGQLDNDEHPYYTDRML